MESQSLIRGVIYLCLSLFLNLGLISADAQELNMTVFGRSSGINFNYVNEIVRDPAGYFWIGTDRGIFRFDGANFMAVPVRRGQQGDVLRLRIFGNDLYVIYRNIKSVDRLDVTGLTCNEFATGDIADIVKVDDSTMVAFERSGKMIRYRNGQINLEQKMVSAFDAVMTIWNGHIFLQAYGKDLYCLNLPDLKIVRSYGLDPNKVIRGGFQPLTDQLIIHHTGSVRSISADLEIHPFKPVPADQFTSSHGFGYHSEKLQYYLRSDRELVIAKDGSFRSLTFPGKKTPELRTLMMVDSVNLLIGTNGSLIHFRNQTFPVSNFNRDNVLFKNQNRVRRNIMPIDKNLTILTGSPAIVRWENDALSAVPYPQLLYFSDLTRLGSRLYGVSENKGLLSYDLKSGRISSTSYLSLADEQGFNCIAADTTAGNLITGGNGALFRIFPERDSISPVADFKERPVNLIRRSADGDWWACTGNGLIRFDSRFRRKQHFSSDSGLVRLTSNYINDVLIEDADRFWVAHDNGAQHVDLKRRMVIDSIPRNMLPDSRVACIRKDSLGRIWFSTFDGILAYDPSTGGYIRLGENSGLINKEFNRRSGAFLPDGRLMFGGDGGYDIIDPYAFTFSQSRPVGRTTAVEWFENSGKVRQSVGDEGVDNIIFDTETESVRISISTQDLLEVSSCRFQFRLNNGLWQDLDGKYHLEIFKLTPGNYTLEFRGFDRYGTMITFNPVALTAWLPVYKRLSFIVIILSALLISLLIILYIIRRSQRKEQHLLEGISMDLHDEVGSVLTRALMVSKTPEFPNRDERVQGYLSDALFSLRAYIRTINRSSIQVNRFLADLRDMIQLHLDGTNIGLRFSQTGDLSGELPAAVSRDIKLSIFEMLNNVLKHSGASKLDIAISLQDGMFHLDFSDNGSMTSTDQLGKRGNGLANLEKRVARHRGTIIRTIRTEGNGLHISATYKI